MNTPTTTQHNQPAAATSPIAALKHILNSDSVKEQFKNCLADSAPLFIASLIDVYGSDKYLQQVDPKSVVMEALKAATLRLPINKGLGLAYIVPYKGQASCQIGYRGYIQLAMRTGAYRYINAGVVYDGELVKVDKLTGEVDLSGNRTSSEVVGYFAHIETVNGFRKTIYGRKADIEAHAKRYSKSYNAVSSPWKTNFDEMATKTMIRQLIGKYGVMSVEFADAVSKDSDDMTPEDRLRGDVEANANQGGVIDIDPRTGEVVGGSTASDPGGAQQDDQPPY